MFNIEIIASDENIVRTLCLEANSATELREWFNHIQELQAYIVLRVYKVKENY